MTNEARMAIHWVHRRCDRRVACRGRSVFSNGQTGRCHRLCAAGGVADANHIGHSERGLGFAPAQRYRTQYRWRTVAACAGYDKLRAPTAYPAVLRLSVIPV